MYVGTHTRVCTYIWSPENIFGRHFSDSVHLLFFYRQGLSLGWNWQSELGWLNSEHLGSSSLCLCRSEVTSVHHYARLLLKKNWFFANSIFWIHDFLKYGLWESNSGPHPCRQGKHFAPPKLSPPSFESFFFLYFTLTTSPLSLFFIKLWGGGLIKGNFDIIL